MTINDVLNPANKRANPFEIFAQLADLDQDSLIFRIRSMPYAKFLVTPYWAAIAATVKSRAGMRCQICNSSTRIAAHHRTYDCHGYEHRSLNDLTCMCDSCHAIFHVKMPAPPRIERMPEELPFAPSAKPRKRERALEKQRFAIDEVAVARDMPDGDPIVLTRSLVERCRTNGSFTNEALRCLGVRRPLVSGWPGRLVGKVISREEYRNALRGRYIYNTGPLAKED